MTAPHVELPQNADELLRDLPLAEPDFEAQAKAIEARLQAPATLGALPDDLLFGAPELAAEPNEPPLPSQVRAAPKGHFAEMARRSLHKPQEDAAALAKELLAATAQSRRPNAELVERMRAAAKSAPTTTPLPLSEPRPERNSGVVPRTEAAPTVPSARVAAPVSDKRGVVIALVGVALAAAAAVALFVGSAPPSAEPSATLAAERARQPEAAQASPAVAPPRNEDGVVRPDELPSAPMAGSRDPEPARPAKPSMATAAASPPKAGAARPGAPQAVELPEDAPQSVASVAPRANAPEPLEPPLRPAQGSNDSVPLNPSSGAVSTALGSVRAGAQACLAGQTDAVNATVTFASDGHVLRVTAGGPSGSCIQAALAKAHVAPFAKESFSAATTIRPP
ncbi:MAG: hypothetical protein EOO73_03565 [Myxococcales bacterium]|nr:MAG: hypothetical protein EOO73_03565 [Myxococcales bacterium]